MEPNAHVQKRTGSSSIHCRVSVPPGTALCIQTVGLTAASPQPYFPNKRVSTLFHSASRFTPRYMYHIQIALFFSRLRTVYTSLVNTYWEYSILRSRIENNLCIFTLSQTLDKIRISIQSNSTCFLRKTRSPGIPFHIISTVKIPTLACCCFWLKLHHSTHFSGAFI